MFWPFKRGPAPEASPAPEEVDVFDRAAERLVEQGLDPRKVEQAARLVKRYRDAGVFPEGYVTRSDEPPGAPDG